MQKEMQNDENAEKGYANAEKGKNEKSAVKTVSDYTDMNKKKDIFIPLVDPEIPRNLTVNCNRLRQTGVGAAVNCLWPSVRPSAKH